VAEPPSADALLFAARRLRADPVGIVFAAMTTGQQCEAAGIPDTLPRASMPCPSPTFSIGMHQELAAAMRETLLFEAAGSPLVAGRARRGLEHVSAARWCAAVARDSVADASRPHTNECGDSARGHLALLSLKAPIGPAVEVEVAGLAGFRS